MAGELVEDELVSLEEALVDCARYGELDEVLEILNSTDPIVDINYQDSSGNTALHVGTSTTVPGTYSYRMYPHTPQPPRTPMLKL